MINENIKTKSSQYEAQMTKKNLGTTEGGANNFFRQRKKQGEIESWKQEVKMICTVQMVDHHEVCAMMWRCDQSLKTAIPKHASPSPRYDPG